MVDHLLIQEALVEDLPSVLALYAQFDMDRGKVLSLQIAREIFERFKSYPNYRLFIAIAQHPSHKVVGTYALMIMNNLAHMGSSSAIVEDVVVSEKHQGQGIGRQMMLHAMELARESKCYKLVLSSNHNRPIAHAFYRSLGFKEHGVSFQVDLP